jgi:hypothetical protein
MFIRNFHTFFKNGKSVKELDVRFDAAEILKTLPIHEPVFQEMNQLSVTHSERDSSFSSGVGSLYNFQTRRYDNKTSDFTVINNHFVGTYVQTVVDEVRSIAALYQKQIGRVRFMRVMPTSCYAMHHDPDEFRFHIPLVTNRFNFFVSNAGVEFMLDIGRLYTFITKEEHTAVNASNHERIHLVFDTF